MGVRTACRSLLFYERAGEVTEFYTANGGAMRLVGRLPASGRNWTHIVSGDFYGDGYSGVLFYEAPTGIAEFSLPVLSDIFSLNFVNRQQGWKTTWSHIVAGQFGAASVDRSEDDLLFYDAVSGTREICRVREVLSFGQVQIELHLLQAQENWRAGWTHIVPGNFGGGGSTDLLFYDAATGVGEFYTVGGGQLTLMRQNTDWRRGWTQIIPGNFGGSGLTDLLFYDAASGTGEFYTTNQGNMRLLHQYTDWRTSWTRIVPGDFDVSGSFHDAYAGKTSLMFYDAAAGTGEFYAVEQGHIRLFKRYDNWRTDWTNVIPIFLELRGSIF